MWLGHPHTGLLPGTYNLLPAVLLGDIAASCPLLNSLPSVNPPLTPLALRQSHLCRPPIAACTASQQQPPPIAPPCAPLKLQAVGLSCQPSWSVLLVRMHSKRWARKQHMGMQSPECAISWTWSNHPIQPPHRLTLHPTEAPAVPMSSQPS
jgi:hypothetical protein